MIASRIPGFTNKSPADMSLRGLLFHPEDRPADIVDIATREPFFTDRECTRLDAILGDMFGGFNSEVQHV